jgi:hypothetical protein
VRKSKKIAGIRATVTTQKSVSFSEKHFSEATIQVLQGKKLILVSPHPLTEISSRWSLAAQ